MLATPHVPRRRGAALLAALVALRRRRLRRQHRHRRRRAARRHAGRGRAGSAGRVRRAARRRRAPAGYTGPPVTIKYAIWGDPPEIDEPDRRSSTRSTRPTRTSPSRSTVSDWDAYWDKLQTGLAGGAAPDVFAMDGPLFPDYQARDVLLDLKPYIDQRRLRPDPAGRPGRRGLHDGRRRPVRPAARPQHDRPLLQQGRCSTRPASRTRTTPGTGTKLVEVAQAADQADANGDGTTDQWGFYTETDGHGELLVSLVWQNGGDILSARRQDHRARHRPGGRRHPVPPGPDLEGQGHARPGDLGRDRRRVRAGPGGHGGQRLVAGADATRRRASTSASRRCPRARPAGSPRSTRPAPSSTRARRRPTPPGSSSSTSPARRRRSSSMQLKASLPVNKEVLAGPYADLVRRRQGVRRQPRLREAQAVVQGLRRVHDDRSRTSSTRTSSTTPTRRPRTRSRTSCPAAQRAPRGRRASYADADGACRCRRSAPSPPPAAARGGAAAPRRRGAVGAAVPGAHPHRPGGPLGRADPRHVRDQPHEVGPADAAAVRRASTTSSTLVERRAVPRRAPQHRVLHAASRSRSGWRWRSASRSRSTRRCAGSPGSARRTSCPVVTSATAVGLVWAWIYSPDDGLLNQVHRGLRAAAPEVDQRPVLGDALDHRDEHLAGPGHQRDHLPRGPPGDPAGVLRRGRRRRRRRAGRASAASPCRCSRPSIFFTGILSLIGAFQVFDQVYVLARPGQADRGDDHARLLHLRERLQELQDGLRGARPRGSCS